MAKYIYKARTQQNELISGTLEAENEQEIVANLDRLGYSVVELKPQELEFYFSGIFSRFKRINKQEVIIFTRQLATLLRSGTALLPSLSVISEETSNKKFKIILEDLRQSVQGGMSFSEAISKYPEVFSEFFINMVNVGETGGILDRVLDRLAKLGTQELELHSRIMSALIYPIVVLAVAFLIVNFLVVGVLPKFVMVFKASQANLPLPTQIVLGLSWILRKLWLFILIALIFLCLWFRNYIRTEKGKFQVHKWIISFPIFGNIYTKIQVSRFTRVLSALTSVGVPLLQALTVVEKIVTNVVIRRAIQNIRLSLAEGHSLVEPFKASQFFSPMVIQMISIGEKSGKLDEMLEEISLFYEPEIEYTIKNLTSLLEPFMLLAMGVMVAFIALAVLLPMFNLIRVFRH